MRSTVPDAHPPHRSTATPPHRSVLSSRAKLRAMNSQSDAALGLPGHVRAWWQDLAVDANSVLVGVSGGADSVALLRAMVGDAGVPDLRVVVGHVDHGLRGEQSAADSVFVEQLAETLGLEHEVIRVELNGEDSEESARRSRYSALEQMAVGHHCEAIVVAHTRDDQVETVLHHLLRGTGLKGLAGMSGRQSLGPDMLLLRPLLEVGREEIESWLRSLGQSWREDETNSRTRFTRNRIRHELLPVLERDYNPRVREALLRVSRLSTEAVGVIDEAVAGVWDGCVLEQSGSVVRLCGKTLGGIAEPLVRALLMELWCRQGWPRQSMSFAHWQALAELMTDGTALDLPGGVTARRNGTVVRIERALGSDPR